jgi:hypothetical protein
MTQSTTFNTLFIGMEVHKDAIAVAYVPQHYGAEVTYSEPSVPDQPTSIPSSASSHPRPSIWCSSTTPDPVAMGSTDT